MPKSQSIRVLCRIRPENAKEKGNGFKPCINVISDNTLRIDQEPSAKEPYHEFTFDHVFPGVTTQNEIFQLAALPLLNEVFDGINCTLFCYGQTSSGKTFTMEGIREDKDLRGIIPRAMEFIFNKISSMSNEIEFSVKCSYYQIYNEKIQDLLDTRKTDLQIREDKTKGIWVDDCTEIYVASSTEMAEVFQCGANNRTVAATEMNKGSSRSHSLFVVTLFQKNIVTDSTKSAKVFFVDLAGSEKMSKTGITGGVGLKEAQNINKSLMTLGMVINALTENSQHIPYRDSKLTRVLQESIGGNSQTTLIITCSPNGINQSESVSTLRFGQRAKLIKNKVVANTVKSVKELMLRIAELEAKIKKYEKTKGKCDTEEDDYDNTKLKTESDAITLSSKEKNGMRVRTLDDCENRKCEKCESYLNEIMNQKVELLTLQEEIDNLTLDKEDLEKEIKDKCNEIYELNEKNFLCEAKDKMIIEDERKAFDNIQLKVETFSLLNQRKKNHIEQIKSSLISNKTSLNEKSYSFMINCIKELSNIIMLERQNSNEILQIINGNDVEDNVGHTSAKSSTMVSNINFNINRNISINVNYGAKSANASPKRSSSRSSSSHNNRRSIKVTTLTTERDKLIKELEERNKELKELNEKLELEKIENEIILKKQNEKIEEMTYKIKEKDEVVQELNEKLCNNSINFEQYKQKTLEDFQTKEMKMMELINKISDLEDENYKLIHFNKDTYKKKYSAMDKQIKQFTKEMQKLISDNSSLQNQLSKKNKEINDLSVKVSELESKVIKVFTPKSPNEIKSINFKREQNMNSTNNLDVSFGDSSFCVPTSSVNGKGYTMTKLNDLLKSKLMTRQERKDSSNSNSNVSNNVNCNENSSVINNKIIKIIRGGNKKKEIAFFSRMLNDKNDTMTRNQELIKSIAMNKEKFELNNQSKMENEMRMLEDDDSSMF